MCSSGHALVCVVLCAWFVAARRMRTSGTSTHTHGSSSSSTSIRHVLTAALISVPPTHPCPCARAQHCASRTAVGVWAATRWRNHAQLERDAARQSKADAIFTRAAARTAPALLRLLRVRHRPRRTDRHACVLERACRRAGGWVDVRRGRCAFLSCAHTHASEDVRAHAHTQAHM